MIFNQQIHYIFPVLVAITGFFLARYIYAKKKKKERLVCLLDSDCDAVVNSQYSTFLGIPLEIYGMFYFALMSLFFLLVIALPQIYSSYHLIILTIPTIALASFFFSIYLIFIQILLIKEWCMWCLASTVITTLLLVAVLMTAPLGIKSILFAFLDLIL